MKKEKIFVNTLQEQYGFTGDKVHLPKMVDGVMEKHPFHGFVIWQQDDYLFIENEHEVYTQGASKQFVKEASLCMKNANKESEIVATGFRLHLNRIKEDGFEPVILGYYFDVALEADVKNLMDALLNHGLGTTKVVRSNSFEKVKAALMKSEASIVEAREHEHMQLFDPLLVEPLLIPEPEFILQDEQAYIDNGLTLRLKEDYLKMYLQKNVNQRKELSIVSSYFMEDGVVYLYDGVTMYLLAKEPGFKPEIKWIDENPYVKVQVYEYSTTSYPKKVVIDVAIDDLDDGNAFLVWYQTLELTYEENVYRKCFERFYLIVNERLEEQLQPQDHVDVRHVMMNELKEHWYFYVLALFLIILFLFLR